MTPEERRQYLTSKFRRVKRGDGGEDVVFGYSPTTPDNASKTIAVVRGRDNDESAQYYMEHEAYDPFANYLVSKGISAKDIRGADDSQLMNWYYDYAVQSEDGGEEALYKRTKNSDDLESYRQAYMEKNNTSTTPDDADYYREMRKNNPSLYYYNFNGNLDDDWDDDGKTLKYNNDGTEVQPRENANNQNDATGHTSDVQSTSSVQNLDADTKQPESRQVAPENATARQEDADGQKGVAGNTNNGAYTREQERKIVDEIFSPSNNSSGATAQAGAAVDGKSATVQAPTTSAPAQVQPTQAQPNVANQQIKEVQQPPIGKVSNSEQVATASANPATKPARGVVSPSRVSSSVTTQSAIQTNTAMPTTTTSVTPTTTPIVVDDSAMRAAQEARTASFNDWLNARKKSVEQQRTNDAKMAAFNALGNALTTMVQPIGWAAGGSTAGVQKYDDRKYLDAFNRAVKAGDDLANLSAAEDEFRFKQADEDYRRAQQEYDYQKRRNESNEDYFARLDRQQKIKAGETYTVLVEKRRENAVKAYYQEQARRVSHKLPLISFTQFLDLDGLGKEYYGNWSPSAADIKDITGGVSSLAAQEDASAEAESPSQEVEAPAAQQTKTNTSTSGATRTATTQPGDAEVSSMYKKYAPADLNKDGVITEEERKSYNESLPWRKRKFGGHKVSAETAAKWNEESARIKASTKGKGTKSAKKGAASNLFNGS